MIYELRYKKRLFYIVQEWDGGHLLSSRLISRRKYISMLKDPYCPPSKVDKRLRMTCKNYKYAMGKTKKYWSYSLSPAELNFCLTEVIT